jgi:hypothetical protein
MAAQHPARTRSRHCSGGLVGGAGACFGFATAGPAASTAFFAALRASCASCLVAKSFASASTVSAGAPSRAIRWSWPSTAWPFPRRSGGRRPSPADELDARPETQAAISPLSSASRWRASLVPRSRSIRYGDVMPALTRRIETKARAAPLLGPRRGVAQAFGWAAPAPFVGPLSSIFRNAPIQCVIRLWCASSRNVPASIVSKTSRPTTSLSSATWGNRSRTAK